MNYTEEKTVEYCENDAKLTYELYKCNKKHVIKTVLLGILWWLWQLTWGALMTYPGLLVTAFCIVFLKGKPHRNGFSYIVEIGHDWGGLEIGACALCQRYFDNFYRIPLTGHDYIAYNHIRFHEFGHNMQQLIFGPFQLFIVFIPSAIRYWYRRINKIYTPPYDSIWFEGTATKWGETAIKKIEGENLKYVVYRDR